MLCVRGFHVSCRVSSGGTDTGGTSHLKAGMASCHDRHHRIHRFNAGETLVKALVSNCKAAVIDAHTVENGSIQLVEVHRVFSNIITEIIRGAVGRASRYPSPGEPHREAAGMMVPAVVLPC